MNKIEMHDPIKQGDKVRFKVEGSNTEYSGIVKEISNNGKVKIKLDPQFWNGTICVIPFTDLVKMQG